MRRFAALFVLAIAIAGCGSTAAERSAAGDSTPAAPPSSDGDAGGDSEGADTATATPDDGPSDTAGLSGDAPFGTVDAVGGGQIDGAELAGQDLALWFWAPW